MAKGRTVKTLANAASTAVDTKKILSDLSNMADTDKVTVVSEKRAGKTIIGIGANPVVFDADGKAEVTALEAKYFLTIPGFNLDGAAEANADAGKSESKDGSDSSSETTTDTEKSDGGKADANTAEANADAGKSESKKAAKGNK